MLQMTILLLLTIIIIITAQLTMWGAVMSCVKTLMTSVQPPGLYYTILYYTTLHYISIVYYSIL